LSLVQFAELLPLESDERVRFREGFLSQGGPLVVTAGKRYPLLNRKRQL
jgi:hypothetical protein